MCSCDDFLISIIDVGGMKRSEFLPAAPALLPPAPAFSDPAEVENHERAKTFRTKKLHRRCLQSRKILMKSSLVTLVQRSDARATIIFFLTSLFIDSIHSISCN
jgi:hypothetical protein